MKKKLISALAAACIFAAALTACGAPVAGTPAQQPAAEEAKEEAEAPAEETAEAAEATEGGVDDGSFNQNNYNGILAFIAENPDSKVTAVREETGDVSACIQTVQDIVADYDVIVCDGFQFAGIGGIAEENPDVKFILVDTNPTDADGNEAA